MFNENRHLVDVSEDDKSFFMSGEDQLVDGSKLARDRTKENDRSSREVWLCRAYSIFLSGY